MSEPKKVRRCVDKCVTRVHAGGLGVTDKGSDGASGDTIPVKHESFFWMHQ